MNFTILIGTCDKYSFLWNNFSYLFNKYWDHSINVDKYFVSETVDTNIDGFGCILPGKVAYNECLRFALNQVNTPYVLWLQDDYFFQKTIPKNKFEEYMDYIVQYKVDRFGLRDKDHLRLYSLEKLSNGYLRMNQNSNYTISMQSSIWNTEFFKKCLSNVSETPWQFEINGSARLNYYYKHNIVYDIIDDPWYYEGMRKGKYTDDYYRILEKENLVH